MSLLEVYCLSRRRDRPTIERFIEQYVDREAAEDRRDEELMMVPLGLNDFARRGEADWEPARTLSHIIARGLDAPPRGFHVYLTPRGPGVHGASLGFTTDDQLVLGLTTAAHDDLALADALLPGLVECCDAQVALIAAETPCPLSEPAFLALLHSPLVVRCWRAWDVDT